MPRKQHKYHFIYKTTNLKNGKYYVGMHSTSNLNDGYLGSGTKLRRSIRKYGKENFRLEILEFFNSREELVKREQHLVNEDMLKDDLCMNLKHGGSGGLHNMTDEEAKLWHSKGGKISWILNRDYHIKRMSSMTRDMWKGGKFDHILFSSWWKGKKHSSETIEKMKEAAAGRGAGTLNSQYGTCWITNGIQDKKIKKTDFIPIGWKLGRK